MTEEQKKKLIKECSEWGKSILCAVIISFVILRFILFIAVVPTGSMIPTIQEGDKFIVARFYKYFDSEHKGLKYGDIVVFRHTDGAEDDSKLLVKRVIGLAGDVISIENGVVYRNGKALAEQYVKNKDCSFMDELTVPQGEMFVLGDNRGNSYDCRYWDKKTVPLSDVVGEALFLK